MARTLLKGWRLGWIAGVIGIGALLLRFMPPLVTPPQLRSVVPVEVPTVCLIAAAISLCISPTITEPAPLARILANGYRRHLGSIRAAVCSLVTICALSDLTATQTLSAAVAVFTVVGENLIAARWLGLTIAWVVPTVHVLAATTLGAEPLGTLQWWAWPADTATHLGQLVVPAAVFGAGLYATWLAGAPPTSLVARHLTEGSD